MWIYFATLAEFLWSPYYSRGPLGRGVKAWNVHHFPTGNSAWKSTTAPRPNLSITGKVGPPSVIQYKNLKSFKSTQNEAAEHSHFWSFVFLLKTFFIFDTSYSFIIQKVHITKIQKETFIKKKVQKQSELWELFFFFKKSIFTSSLDDICLFKRHVLHLHRSHSGWFCETQT